MKIRNATPTAAMIPSSGVSARRWVKRTNAPPIERLSGRARPAPASLRHEARAASIAAAAMMRSFENSERSSSAAMRPLRMTTIRWQMLQLLEFGGGDEHRHAVLGGAVR